MNKLLPIGQRVTHFDGGPNTHGKGTIVEYNGVQPGYAQENLKSAVELVGEVKDPEAKAALAGGIVSSFYSSARYPYVVHFDPSERYPEGYKDAYCDGSIRPIEKE